MLKELITNPFYAIIALITIWQTLNLLLINYLNLNNKKWARLEYIWILIGFTGVISIIIDNDNSYKEKDLKHTEYWIEQKFENLKSLSELEARCIEYNNNNILTENEFNNRQTESNKFCDWVKDEIIPILKKSKQLGYVKIDNYKQFGKLEYINKSRLNTIKKHIININKDIETRDDLRYYLKSNNWARLQNSLGIFLFIIAFALRLTIVTKKVRNI